jgi:hypothetical protein
MSWKRIKKQKGKNSDFSISRKLKSEGRISESFEITLTNLTIEEVIALKLELSSQSVGNRLYGFPIWSALHHIVNHAVLKFALSATSTKTEAMRFLGLIPKDYYILTQKYDLDKLIEEKE